MIQTLLNYGYDADNSQLTTQLFIKDDHDPMNDCDSNGNNDGLVERAVYISLSKLFDLQGGIIHDLFQIKRYLLNQADVKVKLYRATPAFCLSSAEASADYKVDIVDVCLLARKIRVKPAVIYAHPEMLSTTNAKYAFTRTVSITKYSKGQLSFHWDNLFQGQKPNRVVVCFVESSAVSGNYASNPFFFQHCDVRSITSFADGIPVGGAPSKLNFNVADGGTYVRANTDIFQSYGKWKADTGNNISREEFTSGYTLFVFQLEPYFESQDDYLYLIKTVSVRLAVDFDKPLPKTMTCIEYSESPAYFEINKERDIITE